LNSLFGSSEDDIWPALRAALAGWDVDLVPDEGLHARGHGRALVRVAGHEQEYAAIVSESSSVRYAATHAEWSDRRRLVVSDKISPRTAELLRRQHVDYVDLTGAASLRFGAVVVALSGSGRPAMRLERRSSLAQLTMAEPRVTSLFSATRAQVVAVLLAWPQIATEPVRRIAQYAGTSSGLAHDVLRLLHEDGYLVGDDAKYAAPAEAPRLLDAWTANYRTGLRKRLHLGSFQSDLSRWIAAPHEVLVGGEMAIPELLQPSSVTVYVHQLERSLMAGQRMVPP